MPTIKTITTSKATLIAVAGLPEDAWDFEVFNNHNGRTFIDYWIGMFEVGEIILPPGTYTILGFSDELTEEQMEGIGVESETRFIDDNENNPCNVNSECEYGQCHSMAECVYVDSNKVENIYDLEGFLKANGIEERVLILKLV